MAAEETHSPNSPTGASSLPQYQEMIMAAIDSINDKNGCNKSVISRYIETTYGQLPAAHSTLLSHHLNSLKDSGELIMVKNNYMKPDPDAPPKRGRGRPPKPKAEPPPGFVPPPSRPRGRPPKARDPLDPPPAKKPKPPSGRPRGRPPKDKDAAAPAQDSGPIAVAAAPVTGGTRPRGRPPKAKQAVAAVGC